MWPELMLSHTHESHGVSQKPDVEFVQFWAIQNRKKREATAIFPVGFSSLFQCSNTETPRGHRTADFADSQKHLFISNLEVSTAPTTGCDFLGEGVEAGRVKDSVAVKMRIKRGRVQGGSRRNINP